MLFHEARPIDTAMLIVELLVLLLILIELVWKMVEKWNERRETKQREKDIDKLLNSIDDHLADDVMNQVLNGLSPSVGVQGLYQRSRAEIVEPDGRVGFRFSPKNLPLLTKWAKKRLKKK